MSLDRTYLRWLCASLLLGASLWACTTITGPDVTNYNVNENGQEGRPGASPSPGEGGTLPPGSFVRVGQYGQSCPAGVTVPANGSRQIKVGCTAFITATPKDAAGNDLPAAIHGPNIAWNLSPVGASFVTLLAESEPFNRSAKCLGTGIFTLSATVKGVTGTADFECVSAASLSEAGKMDGAPSPPYPPPAGPDGIPPPAGGPPRAVPDGLPGPETTPPPLVQPR